MRTVPLFASALTTVREVICDAPRGAPCAEEESAIPCVAIPLSGCFAVERTRQSVVADANTALFFESGSYRVGHPAEGGDVCFVLACEPSAIAEAFANDARSDFERRPFRATHAHLPSRLQLRARLFRRALLLGEVASLAADEEAMGIVAALAGSRAPVVDRARRAAVERVKAHLAGRFREPVTLADAALVAGTSPFTLARIFPASEGTTLHRYLVGLRLASALQAIASGASDLSRVALDAGFAHHSHLTKSFARAFGAAPRRIRERLA